MLAISSAALAISAHSIADGGVHTTAATPLVTALIGYAGTTVADRARGPLGVLAVLAAAQLAMHLALTGFGGHSTTAQMVPGPSMLTTHAVATVLTAVLLCWAEHLLRMTLVGVRLLLPVLCRPVPAIDTPPPAARTLSAAVRPVISVTLRRIHRRRGPPITP